MLSGSNVKDLKVQGFKGSKISMQILFEQTIESTPARLLARRDWQDWQGQLIEIWVYQDRHARLDLQKRLTAMTGAKVMVRSAYKPLLHYFLEDTDPSRFVDVQIHYPVHPNADPKRFLLEAYPLASMLGHCKLQWIARPHDDQNTQVQPQYQLKLTEQDGQVHRLCVDAPNKIVLDHLQEAVLCPTGYLRVTAQDSGRILHEETFACEIEKAFSVVMDWMRQYPWSAQEPYFERLEIQVDVPGAEIEDDHGTLMVSTLEALHEDFYFSVLEFFQRHSGRPKGNRGLQPGQIVPDIRRNESEAKVRVVLYPVGAVIASLSGTISPSISRIALSETDLAQCETSLLAEQVDVTLSASLAAWKDQGAQSFEFKSHQGRSVRGLIRPGQLPAIVVSGAQHANEPSGVVGALRGANWLAAQPEAHFALIALENPDGYELCREYRQLHPQHMHHAARYTSLGDDLEYREKAPWYEREARMHAVQATQAQLHISLHGYPAHEWTRPFTGYLPRGFELWSIPKGFFLIVRYQQAWRQKAETWLDMITIEMSRIPGLAEFNQRQLEVYANHAGSLPFEVRHGIPCLVTQNDQQTMGVKLVTEFPDETVYGEAFKFAQEVQTQSVRIASQAWWKLNSA